MENKINEVNKEDAIKVLNRLKKVNQHLIDEMNANNIFYKENDKKRRNSDDKKKK